MYNGNMGDFEVHKIIIETLGEYLVGLREDLGLSVEYIAKQVGVAPRLMFALESGNFKDLPESVYVVAILKKLALQYGISAQPLIAEYNREVAIYKQSNNVKTNTWQVLAHRLAPLRWASVLAVFGGLLFLGLCIWQVLAIGTTPTVRVATPQAGQRLSGGLVDVTGFATPGSEVLINGQIVYAGGDGYFASSLSFMPGAQSLTISAKSRFGKMKSQTISFLVEPSNTAEIAGPSLANGQSIAKEAVR